MDQDGIPDWARTFVPRPETEATEDPVEQMRQMKLRLPTEQVMKLHHLRILRGGTVSHYVADALEEYFAEQRARRAAHRDE